MILRELVHRTAAHDPAGPANATPTANTSRRPARNFLPQKIHLPRRLMFFRQSAFGREVSQGKSLESIWKLVF
jgi:hypothetical protein